MDRDEQLELLSAHADGELDEEELELVEKLLKSDKDAAFESTQLVQMKQIIQRWEGVQGSGRVRQAVLERVGREKPASAASGFVSFLLGVVAALLILAGGFFLFHYWLMEKLAEQATTQPSASAPQPARPITPGPTAPTRPPIRAARPGTSSTQQRPEPAAAAQAPWAQVVRTNGSVMVFDARGRPTPARPGLMIGAGRRLVVGEQTIADLKLPHGGLMRLQKRARVNFKGPSAGVELLGGVILIQYPGAEAGAGSLPVEADRHRIMLERNNLRALVSLEADGALRVALLRGRLTVDRRGQPGQPVILTAGKTLTVKTDGSLVGPLFYRGDLEFGDFGGAKRAR